MKNILVTRQSPVWSCSPPKIFFLQMQKSRFFWGSCAASLSLSFFVSLSIAAHCWLITGVLLIWSGFQNCCLEHFLLYSVQTEQNSLRNIQSWLHWNLPLSIVQVLTDGTRMKPPRTLRGASAHFMAWLLLKWNWCLINNFRVTNIHLTITAVQWYSFGISQFHFGVLFIRKWLKK